MRTQAAHYLDEVPVFACRVTVALDVSDQLRVGLACCIEAERGLNLLVLQVTVNSFGATNYLYTILLCCIVLCKHTSVRVGVIATNDDKCFDTAFAKNLDALLELVFLFDLCAARANDVKTTGVAVLVHQLRGDFHIIVVNKTARAENETIELVGRIERFYTIEKARNHVVAARSLTSRKDDAHIECRQLNRCTGFKCDDRHAIRVGE